MKIKKENLPGVIAIILVFISLSIPILYGINLGNTKIIYASVIKIVLFIGLVSSMFKRKISYALYLIFITIYLAQEIRSVFDHPELSYLFIYPILANSLNLFYFGIYKVIRYKMKASIDKLDRISME